MAATGADEHFAVCVFCGARAGGDEAIVREAEALGAGVAAEVARLLYGAGDLGLMGCVSAAARAAGGSTIGVIPRGLWEREVRRRPLPADVIVENLHQRKSVMLANAHAVVALPGGLGTLDELIEAVSWAQLGLHKKPIFLMNFQDYWAPLLALFDHMRDAGFLHAPLEDVLRPTASTEETLAALSAFRETKPRL